jgi:hypothetical protein
MKEVEIIHLSIDRYSYFHVGIDRASLGTDWYPDKNFIKSQTLVPLIQFKNPNKPPRILELGIIHFGAAI